MQPRLPAALAGVRAALAAAGRRPPTVIAMVNPTGRGGAVVRATLDGDPVEMRGGRRARAARRDGGEHEVRLELG